MCVSPPVILKLHLISDEAQEAQFGQGPNILRSILCIIYSIPWAHSTEEVMKGAFHHTRCHTFARYFWYFPLFHRVPKVPVPKEPNQLRYFGVGLSVFVDCLCKQSASEMQYKHLFKKLQTQKTIKAAKIRIMDMRTNEKTQSLIALVGRITRITMAWQIKVFCIIYHDRTVLEKVQASQCDFVINVIILKKKKKASHTPN